MVPLAREAPLAVKPPADAKSVLPSAPSSSSNLTPPLTPIEEDSNIPILGSVQSQISPLWAAQLDGPSECSLTLQYRRGQDGKLIEYGKGAWSSVYSAISVDHALSLNASPPRTPTRGSSASSPRLGPLSTSTSNTTMYAVKVASGRESFDAISAEADILTYLHRAPGSTAHIVPFHGYIPSQHAIVMTAIPLSFATYIKTRARDAAAAFSTRTMFKPVLGMATWLSLASKLVEGMSWLHEVGVVHGDIKPQNILLRPRIPIIGSSTATTSTSNPSAIDDSAVDAFDPLFIDFTSSLYSHNSNAALNSSAGTRLATSLPFTAPELLSLSSMTAAPTPEPSSDVFSLALTLVAAAIGYVDIYPGLDRHRGITVAKDGHRVIEFVRSGDQGTRIPRKGVAERVISPAVLKEAEKRATAGQWLEIIRGEIAVLNRDG